MTLQPCPICNHSVSPQAQACPNCGHPLNIQKATSPVYQEQVGLTFWGVVGAIIVAIILISFC